MMTTGCRRRLSYSICALVILLMAARVSAQEVGTVVAVEGAAEIQRAGTVIPAVVGGTVVVGDTIRTTTGRLKVALQDGSVLNIGTESRLVIDRQVFEPDRRRFESFSRLLSGAVRVLVSEYYAERGASYQVETPTAVAGVRGTEFVIAYNPVVEVTEVVGVTGKTNVHSVMDRVKRGVTIGVQEMTSVARGKFPTAPVHIGDALFRQYIEGLDFIGGGRSESMSQADPWMAGGSVPPQDRVDAMAPLPSPGGDKIAEVPSTDIELPGDVGTLLQDPPAAVQGGGLGIHF